MAFEDLKLTPEAVEAVRGFDDLPPRPPGHATIGLTDKRKVVVLADLKLADMKKTRIVKVTAPGWLHWYPVRCDDYNNRYCENAGRQAAAKQANTVVKKPGMYSESVGRFDAMSSQKSDVPGGDEN